jgi:glutamate N-acetyltransferase/amino-acid N-acetyltransferase
MKSIKDSPKGFLFSTAEAAIKKPGRKDLALIYSEGSAVMSGMFTTNKVKAAPVRLDMKRIASGRGQAVLVNSGNANACTGTRGMADAVEMTDLVAKGLNLDANMVYTCSTGVIGARMPMGRMRQGVLELVQSLGKGTIHDVASAIMTTDTFPKVVSRRIKVGKMTGTVTGICKGAGMICPNMATMLCFLMTDIAIEQPALTRALRDAVEKSFNAITVDGDMSTNDTVLIMANGMAGNSAIRENTMVLKRFSSAVSDIACHLSRMIVKDGEGATKIVEVEVRNAKSKRDAKKAALAIANSLLVKTALYGNDANWGRIMAALGYSGITMKEELTDISLGKVRLVTHGIGTGKDREASRVLRGNEIKIGVNLRLGTASATVLTCDLTEEYVRINAEYRT